MDNSNISRNKQNELLGINKIGKNIRKSPLHQPNLANNIANSSRTNYNNNGAKQKPQPKVYNISKHNFRSIVQQLTTSSPSPTNPPKHLNTRLQRFRPPPLSPINPSLMSHVVATQVPMVSPESHYNSNSNSNNFGRPPTQFGQRSPIRMLPSQFGHGQVTWTTPALSPISAYVHQLQSCIGEDGPMPGQHGLQQQFQGSLYPLLSPGSQFPKPLSPNFAISPFGFLGPGPQPALSPGISFPLSPSRFFPIYSPRWRDQ